MATTTPNFGWTVPTSSDLVKNGATAIETLGDAIDASLVDLKGGTTGQVLSKATNTDMDFTWTTPAGGGSGFTLISNQALSAQASINFNSCFSSTYRNYKVIMNLTSTATDPIRMRLRSGSTDATGANYNLQYSEVDNATAGGFRLSGETSFRFSPVRSSGTTFVVLDINNPFIAAATSITGSGIDPANPNYNAYTENHTLATSYDGMTVFAATYNLTGNIAVYGYGA